MNRYMKGVVGRNIIDSRGAATLQFSTSCLIKLQSYQKAKKQLTLSVLQPPLIMHLFVLPYRSTGVTTENAGWFPQTYEF